MTRDVLKDRRWQLAWWGGHLMGAALFLACVGWPPSWWEVLALAAGYLTGFWSAVLVEYATR